MNIFKKMLTKYQIQLLCKRMYLCIYAKSREITKLNKEFKYLLHEITKHVQNIFSKVNETNGEEKYKYILEKYRNAIIVYKEKIINNYSKCCKILNGIEVYLKKTNIINKNFNKTVEVFNKNKYYIDRMKMMLINHSII